MPYEVAFDGKDIQTNGEHIDDIDHLSVGESLTVRYRVANTGGDEVPDHYDFLSITDNALAVEYEDWAQRDGFERSAQRSFDVPIPLSSGIHWVFVTVDGGSTAPKAAARLVVIARDDAERHRLIDELRRGATPPSAGGGAGQGAASDGGGGVDGPVIALATGVRLDPEKPVPDQSFVIEYELTNVGSKASPGHVDWIWVEELGDAYMLELHRSDLDPGDRRVERVSFPGLPQGPHVLRWVIDATTNRDGAAHVAADYVMGSVSLEVN